MRLLPFLRPTKGVQIAGGGFPDSGGGGGSYTLPPATDTTLGGVKIGSGVNVTSDGTISVNGGGSYTLPPATSETLGGIKVGSRLSVESDGTLSATDQSYTLPTASASTLGGVKVGNGLSITDGVLSTTGGSGGSWTRVATATSTGVETTAEMLSTLFNQITIDTTKTYVLCYGYLRCYATIVDSSRIFFQQLVNVPTAQSSHCFQMQANPSDCHYYYGLLAVGSPATFTMTDKSTNPTTSGEFYNVFVLN